MNKNAVCIFHFQLYGSEKNMRLYSKQKALPSALAALQQWGNSEITLFNKSPLIFTKT